jgi:hypothetical protein
MTRERTLFVTWYDPERRAILPVGRLVERHDDQGPLYEFRYIRGALEACQHNFLPFYAFPELHKTYLSRGLFPFFTNRVIPTTRPDYQEYVEMLGLERNSAEPFTILERSGGGRQTDRIEVIPAPLRDEETGAYRTHFLVRGIRYFPGSASRIERLTPSERLFWMLDAQNAANPGAVALRTEDRYLLGYVPDYLLPDVEQLVTQKIPLDIRVARANPSAPLHHRLLCSLEARWPEKFVPFQGEQFEPLEPHAATDPSHEQVSVPIAEGHG